MTHPTAKQDGITTGDFDGDGRTDIAVSHWGGDRITVIYKDGEGGTKWDIRHYLIPTNGYGHVTAGKFGPLQQTALIYTCGQGLYGMSILTFNNARQIKNRYDMTLAPGDRAPSSAVVVKKGAGKPGELWVTYSANRPNSKVSIWRGLQANPDTSFGVYDCPEAIQSANLDCDDDEEPVLLHGGWNATTVFTNSENKYQIYTPSHYYQDGLALGDVNNDGRIDILAANGISPGDLMILYNSTQSCWPTALDEINAATKELIIYPNPAQQNTTITYSGKGRLLITDAQGRSVHNISFHQIATVDMAPWAAGIYFAILHTDDGVVWTKKLVKE